ncbi:anaerobic ribonucleoside-triphosphate reductase activating protein [Demequina capsici]|uniref:Anaerobic ribonucleoside-triphosphate reductase activating protein n=1 Tax=Demequina capsici TaxID=3075620 RepID=A0AA96FCT2_9MICO|nr:MULTISPECIES: anaerobic ribonucleoside-triphosphate reductase activating protein [unclassified Demequina]WNM24846.1 anaerobic ribonucleoside-triphosphate reductase activating protein [Demequina sp. OYTSA14]WNM27753.1 anaerobic ribonucleoside-triphosphate reductase activating protein [Demequina sp. PMTSA13]
MALDPLQVTDITDDACCGGGHGDGSCRADGRGGRGGECKGEGRDQGACCEEDAAASNAEDHSDALPLRPLHRPVFTEGWSAPLPSGELTFEEVCLKARGGDEQREPAFQVPHADRPRASAADAARQGFGEGFDPRYLAIAALSAPNVADWPGHLASTVLLQGCPWRCTYCFNTDLQDSRKGGAVEWESVERELRARRDSTDAVVFSGGEPTRQGALADAMRIVKEMGYKVGLQTAGAFPGRLELALQHCDWVALDIKATPDGYTAITRTGMAGRRAYAALDIVRDSGVPFEVRLTVDPVTHSRQDILDTVAEIERRTGRAPVLQEVRSAGTSATYAAELADRCLADVLEPGDLPELVRR